MAKEQIPHKILWLASYPKSGNTWFRAFLTALMNDGKVDINDMDSDGIFSSRDTFDLISEVSSRDLYDDEAKLMLADVYRQIAVERDSLSIVKVHDAFGPDPEGKNLIPEDVTLGAIYFIRNPLDIAGSLANHMNFSMDEAVNMLNNSMAYMAGKRNNLNKKIQFSQYISDWSSHVKSWTAKPSFPVYVMRYEDMLENTFDTFSKALNFIGWEYTPEQISRAMAASDFEKLSNQEAEKGFKEKPGKSMRFFRAGTKGNWEKELSGEQVKKIIAMHKQIMCEYKYLNKDEYKKIK
jgi:hypothetical protein